MQVQESAVSVKTSSQLGGSSQLGESGSQGGSSQLGGIFQQPPAGQKRHVYLDTRHPKYGIRLEVCVTKNACSWINLHLMSLIALTRRISHTVEIKRTFSVWFHYISFTIYSRSVQRLCSFACNNLLFVVVSSPPQRA